ncbi:MAG TPA: hypothetical protein VGJ76_14950 [Pseudolabrys sp.]
MRQIADSIAAFGFLVPMIAS